MNSSIFNSDSIRGYCRRGNRIHLFHLAVILLMILLTIVSSQLLISLNTRPYRPNFRTEAVRKLDQKTEVLLLGASRFFSNINPNSLPFNAMSLSTGSLNYATQFAILKKNIRKVPNLKLCILELDDVPLRINTVDNRMNRFQGDFRDIADLGLCYWEIPDLPIYLALIYWIKDLKYIRPVVSGPKLTIDQLIDTYLKKKNNFQDEASIKITPGFRSTTMRYIPKKINADPKKINRKASIYNKEKLNRKALLEMLKFLRQNGIAVIFIQFPRYHDHPKEARTRHTAMTSRLSALVKPVLGGEPIILDYSFLPQFAASDFRDQNHLNIYGAKKLTGLVDRDMRKTARNINLRLHAK